MKISNQKIAHVDLSSSNVKFEEIDNEMRKNYIGGGGINTKILYDSDAMYHDPLSDKNVLVFGAGCLVGTGAMSCNRMVVSAKSPLTDMYGDSNVGGSFPIRMRSVGIDHLVISGRASELVYLLLKADGTIEICPAEGLRGKHTNETVDILVERHGDKCEVACIGMAGENMVLYASVIISKIHAAGRMGMGCVMGSKNLKAIVIEYNEKKFVAHRPEEFNNVRFKWVSQSKKAMHTKLGQVYGSLFLMEINMKNKQLPVKNAMQGTAEDEESILPDMFKVKHQTKKITCHSCPVACSKSYGIKEGRFKGEKGSRMEYGAAVIGPYLGIYEWDKIIHLKLLCDYIGVDTIEMASSVGLVLEGFEKGLIDEGLVGRKVSFGDIDDIEYLVRKMAQRDGIGSHIANGAYRAGNSLGCADYAFCINKSSTALCTNKRLVRSLGYITSTRGGDHLKSFAFSMQNGGYYIARHLFKIKNVKKQLDTTDKVGRVLWWHENHKNVVDAIGLCLFAMQGLTYMGCAFFDDFAEIIGSQYGFYCNEVDILKASERIYQLQNSFNVNCGLSLGDYKWPIRKKEDGLDERYIAGSVIKSRDEPGMLPEYFAYRGLEMGIPSYEKFSELEMSEYFERAQCVHSKTAKSFDDILKEVKITVRFKLKDRIYVNLSSKLMGKLIQKKSEKTQKKIKKKLYSADKQNL